MSTSLGSVMVAIKATDECSSVMDKIRSSMGLLGGALQSLGGGFAGLGNVVQGFAAAGVAGAVIGAVGAVTQGLQSVIKEATTSEAVWASLSAAVEKSGYVWETVKKGTEDALLAMSKVTTYSDEELAAALQQLMSFGLSYDEAMKALGDTIDFATAKHMDLGSAANVVAKAIKGNTALLKRYGVNVTTSAQATKALREMQDRLTTALKLTGKTMEDPAFADFIDTLTEAGIAVQDANHKVLPLKDIVESLFKAFEEGQVDTDFMQQAFQDLGLEFDDTQLKAAGAEEVLGALNQQFGGAAQNAANTYAGTQERLNNAWGEVQEKLGNIFLPLLTKITEAMIPIIDKIGGAVEGFQKWIDAIGKTPEGQKLIEAIQGIFVTLKEAIDKAFTAVGDFLKALVENPEFKKFMGDLATFAGDLDKALRDLAKDPKVKKFLDDLSDLVKQLAEWIIEAADAIKKALTPEIIGAIKDLKDLAEAVDYATREFGKLIKAIGIDFPEATSAFGIAAQGITYAFDMLVRWPLELTKAILETTAKLLEAARIWVNVFQDFYDWLVGRSLWQDMWNKMLSIAVNMGGQILSKIKSALINPLEGAIRDGLTRANDVWTSGWNTLSNAAQSIWDSIKNATQSWLDGLKSAFSKGLDPFKEAWTGMWNSLSTGAASIWNGIISAVSRWVGLLESAFKGPLLVFDAWWTLLWAGIGRNVSNALRVASGGLGSFYDATVKYLGGIWQQFKDTFIAIAELISRFITWLVTFSVWPDFLTKMQAQTATGLSAVAREFASTFAGIRAITPTLSVGALGAGAGGAGGASASPIVNVASSPVNLTVPVRLDVDGQAMYQVVEKRMVNEYRRGRWNF